MFDYGFRAPTAVPWAATHVQPEQRTKPTGDSRTVHSATMRIACRHFFTEPHLPTFRIFVSSTAHYTRSHSRGCISSQPTVAFRPAPRPLVRWWKSSRWRGRFKSAPQGGAGGHLLQMLTIGLRGGVGGVGGEGGWAARSRQPVVGGGPFVHAVLVDRHVTDGRVALRRYA